MKPEGFTWRNFLFEWDDDDSYSIYRLHPGEEGVRREYLTSACVVGQEAAKRVLVAYLREKAEWLRGSARLMDKTADCLAAEVSS